jgi:hypothetical protein
VIRQRKANYTLESDLGRAVRLGELVIRPHRDKSP